MDTKKNIHIAVIYSIALAILMIVFEWWLQDISGFSLLIYPFLVGFVALIHIAAVIFLFFRGPEKKPAKDLVSILMVVIINLCGLVVGLIVVILAFNLLPQRDSRLHNRPHYNDWQRIKFSDLQPE